MDNVSNIRLIEYPTAEEFMEQLKFAINDSQKLGLDVEIQYARGNDVYSALLINRKGQ